DQALGPQLGDSLVRRIARRVEQAVSLHVAFNLRNTLGNGARMFLAPVGEELLAAQIGPAADEVSPVNHRRLLLRTACRARSSRPRRISSMLPTRAAA